MTLTKTNDFVFPQNRFTPCKDNWCFDKKTKAGARYTKKIKISLINWLVFDKWTISNPSLVKEGASIKSNLRQNSEVFKCIEMSKTIIEQLITSFVTSSSPSIQPARYISIRKSLPVMEWSSNSSGPQKGWTMGEHCSGQPCSGVGVQPHQSGPLQLSPSVHILVAVPRGVAVGRGRGRHSGIGDDVVWGVRHGDILQRKGF